LTDLNKNGIILSFDALLAVTVVFFLFLVINSNLAGIEENPFSGIYLREMALDTATLLEQSGKLERLVRDNDSSQVRQFLNQLPGGFCTNVQVFNSTDLNAAQIVVSRDGCRDTTTDLVTLHRSFVVVQDLDANYFVARVDAWRQA